MQMRTIGSEGSGEKEGRSYWKRGVRKIAQHGRKKESRMATDSYFFNAVQKNFCSSHSCLLSSSNDQTPKEMNKGGNTKQSHFYWNEITSQGFNRSLWSCWDCRRPQIFYFERNNVQLTFSPMRILTRYILKAPPLPFFNAPGDTFLIVFYIWEMFFFSKMLPICFGIDFSYFDSHLTWIRSTLNFSLSKADVIFISL